MGISMGMCERGDLNMVKCGRRHDIASQRVVKCVVVVLLYTVPLELCFIVSFGFWIWVHLHLTKLSDLTETVLQGFCSHEVSNKWAGEAMYFW